MSWCDRRTILMLLPAALAACGFAPVYGPGGAGTALQGRIEVAAPQGENAYVLVRELESRLGRAAQPDYRLTYDLRTVTQGQAVTASNDTTRYSIVGTVDYKLTRLSDDRVIASGQVRNFTGYSATGTTVETLAGENDAQERLMTILADQITAEILSTADLSA